MDYYEYIDSEDWAERKRSFYATHKRKCRCCNSWDSIHLHHLTYERLGAEADGDLAPLCADCHLEVHRRYKLFGGDLSNVTYEMIRERKDFRRKHQQACQAAAAERKRLITVDEVAGR